MARFIRIQSCKISYMMAGNSIFQKDKMEYEPFLGEQAETNISLDGFEMGPSAQNRRRTNKRRMIALGCAGTAALFTLFVLGLVFAGRHASTSPAPINPSGGTVEPTSEIPEIKPSDIMYEYKSAAVAADTTVCSTVGKRLLLSGGNAVDAAVGALLCSGLASPQSMGIGGGFFMTIYNATSKQSTIIDARETAPEKATVDMYGGDAELAAHGSLSIAVPGEIKGYWLAHQKYGKLPWSVVFKPAIKMAKDGFRVPIGLHNAIQDDKELLLTEPSLREIFFNPRTNKLYQYNEIMFRPELAKTLEIISGQGIKALEEEGVLLDRIMEDLKDIGAIIAKKDIKEYKAIEKTPLEITLDNSFKLYSPPPPASGAVLSFMMNILEGYKLTSKDIADTDAKILTYHRTVEAFKFAYAKRTALGDEDYVNVDALVRNLTSKAYAAEIRQKITDDTTHDPEYYEPTYYTPQKTGTSHLSVLDQDGSAVSVTSTVNGRFGAQLRGTRSGIIWNNEMDDFSAPNITNIFGVKPSPANFIVPGKRPLSSMCPAVMVTSKAVGEGSEAEKEGDVRLVVGAAGGTMITTAVAWVSEHNLWLGKNIKESVDKLRLHHQLFPEELQYEEGFEKPVLEGMEEKGHNLTSFKVGGSVTQAIEVQDGKIFAESDFRKGGTPDGY